MKKGHISQKQAKHQNNATFSAVLIENEVRQRKKCGIKSNYLICSN